MAERQFLSHLDVARDEAAADEISIDAFEPGLSNNGPKIAKHDKTSWEIWYFDAVSTTGEAITVSFFRDHGRSPLHKEPGYRVSLHLSQPDGQVFSKEFFCTESVVERAEGATTTSGAWKGAGHEVTFEIRDDLSAATLRVDSDDARGAIELAGPPSHERADPRSLTDGDYAVGVPSVYWSQQMPAASCKVDLSVDGKQAAFAGMGGYERMWSAKSWMTIMEESVFMRASAGRHTLLLLRIISRAEPERECLTAVVYEDGKVVFRSKSPDVSLTEDYVSFRFDMYGQVRGKHRDYSSGYSVDLVSPGQKRHWQFKVKHQAMWFSRGTGPKTGNNGFVEHVVGGEISGDRPLQEGVGVSGHCQLPSLEELKAMRAQQQAASAPNTS